MTTKMKMILVVSCLALAGCGGGGGGGGGAVVAAAPPPPPSEFDAQQGLGLINAQAAYDRGFTGAGIIVAVLDSGLDVTHPEFAGRIAAGGFDFVDGTSNMTDPEGHGTFVSGIIAANQDGVQMHGVAFNSRILPIRIIDQTGVVAVTDAELAAAFDLAVANGAGVINNSWGRVDPIDSFTAAFIEATAPLALQAARDAVNSGTIVVFAAGNGLPIGFVNPNLEAALPSFFPELEAMWVAVMAVDLNGNQPLYTNRCGVAAAWCIAAPGGGDAPGSGIFSTNTGGGYDVASGTSFAAPHVSGALAILLELFSLNAAEARNRLFVSANSTGIYGDPLIFGHGLLDLEAATRPIGTVFVLVGDGFGGPAFALDTTRVNLGSAFGDGLQSSLSGTTLALFDSLDAPFYLDLGALVNVASGRLDLDSILRKFGKGESRQTVSYSRGELSFSLGAMDMRGDDFGDRTPGLELKELSFTQQFGSGSELTFNYNTHPAYAFGLHESGTVDRTMMVSTDAFAAPYLSFGERGYNFAAATELAGFATIRLGSFFGEAAAEDGGKSVGTTAELALSVGERANLGLQLGMMSEFETFLGSETEGAFNLEGGVPTYFGGLSGEVALTDTWKLVGSAYAGLSYPEAAANSLFADVSPILTQSFTVGIVGAGVFRDTDRFGLLVNQPLRVTRGSAELAFTTGRDPERNVFSDRVTADLAPEGREIDLEAFYTLSVGEDTALTTSAMLRSEPGHIEDARAEGVFMLRMEHKF